MHVYIYIYIVNLKSILKHWNQLQSLEIHRQFNHDLNLPMTRQDPRVPRALFLTRLLPGGLGITSPTRGTADFQSPSRCLSWQPQIQTLTGPTSSLVTSGSCRWLLRTGEGTKRGEPCKSYPCDTAGNLHPGFGCSFLHVPVASEKLVY